MAEDIGNSSLGPDIFIKSITFSDGTIINLSHSDIIVFTGPNNSGKSQSIKDVLELYQGVNDEHVVIKNIKCEQIGEPNDDYLNNHLFKIGYNYFCEGHVFSDRDTFKQFWSSKSFNVIGKFFIEYLSTESRLALANTTRSINPLTEAPSHPLHYLYVKDSIEKSISKLIEKAFGEHLCLNRGLGASVALHVGKKVELQRGEDRVSERYLRELSSVPVVDKQGDGIRSFTGILLHLLTSDKTVTLIDEPEAFLHPPQARLLGEMIAKQNKKQMLISTHSEDFLKGIIDKGGNRVKIIRITREGDINPIARLDNTQIKTIWNDPVLKFSNLLSGLFHHKVVICEADTDCRFYQAIMNAIADDTDYVRHDVLFTYSGGKERLKVMAAALKPLRVPLSVVADIDILDDKDKFKALSDALEIKWDDIANSWKCVSEYVLSQRPQLETSDVKKEINRILDKVTEVQLPKNVNEELHKVLKQSSAWGKVKDVGMSFLKGQPYDEFKKLDKVCRDHGLFIVPVGQLESFYRPNSSHGTKWVNSVLENVNLKTDEELKDAWDFVKAVVG